MKKIILGCLLCATIQTVNAQLTYYCYGSLTQLSWNLGFSFGGVVESRNQQFSFSRIGYVESVQDFFGNDIKPEVVSFSNTYAIQYGYVFDTEASSLISFVPSLGLGLTQGKWRTSEIEQSNNGGAFFSFGPPNYREIFFSHVSVIPQLEMQVRTDYIGGAIGSNYCFIPANFNYGTHTFYVKVMIGLMK